MNIFHKALNKNPIFNKNEEAITYLIQEIKVKLFLPEDNIIQQGDIASSFFFLSSGHVDIYVVDENQVERYTTTLSSSDYFGEVALIKNCLRTATVVSKNYTTCADISSEYFTRLSTRFSFIRKQMEKHIRRKYNDRWKAFLKRSLRTIDYFR